jgi:hypothetical protein
VVRVENVVEDAFHLIRRRAFTVACRFEAQYRLIRMLTALRAATDEACGIEAITGGIFGTTCARFLTPTGSHADE